MHMQLHIYRGDTPMAKTRWPTCTQCSIPFNLVSFCDHGRLQHLKEHRMWSRTCNPLELPTETGLRALLDGFWIFKTARSLSGSTPADQ